MILTQVPRDALAGSLDRFAAGLRDPIALCVFAEIRATSADRAVMPEAEEHRLAALALARCFGMAVHPP
ncbi:MAG TPA: hypothetical protein VGI28_03020, partial [Stellaceae bacterium]